MCGEKGAPAHCGKVPLLDRQAHREGMALLGLQETRTKGPSRRSSAHHLIVASGADKGSFGCELWVAAAMA